MTGPMIGVLVVIALGILAALAAVAVLANRFARQRQLVIESWRQVEVELQRRYDLRRALEALPGDSAADDHRAHLLHQLAEAEDRIAAARRFYNGNVRALRTRTATFPANVVAGLAGVRLPDYFAAEPGALRGPSKDRDPAR